MLSIYAWSGNTANNRKLHKFATTNSNFDCDQVCSYFIRIMDRFHIYLIYIFFKYAPYALSIGNTCSIL